MTLCFPVVIQPEPADVPAARAVRAAAAGGAHCRLQQTRLATGGDRYAAGVTRQL